MRSVLILLCAVAGVRADVSLAPLFRDNAVLQRDEALPVWGRADRGERVSVSLDGQTTSVVADESGRWMIKLAPRAASALPTELVVEGKNRLVVRDVVFGDVWLCAGQSNMQMAAAKARDAAREAAAADFPLIRQFKVANQFAATPQETVGGVWVACTPESFGGFTAAGVFFARELWRELGVPIGLVNSSYGNTPIASWRSSAGLAGEPVVAEWWRMQQAATLSPRPHRQPSSCYNGMIAPLLPYALRGMLWYQGESDATEAEMLEPVYARQFARLIGEWRAAFQQGDRPFFWVQLAGYGQAGARAWTAVRAAQATALTLPGTGQAVALDVGDATSIHPTNKQAIGERLARLALHRVYGRDVVDTGPELQAAEEVNGALRLRFYGAGNGLVAHGDLRCVFEVAGRDGRFVAATDVTLDAATLTVASAEVRSPVAVRYAWTNFPGAWLANRAGLPAAPFQRELR